MPMSGAQFSQQRPTFAVLGDGGFQMTQAELATAAIHSLPVKCLIINNNYIRDNKLMIRIIIIFVDQYVWQITEVQRPVLDNCQSMIRTIHIPKVVVVVHESLSSLGIKDGLWRWHDVCCTGHRSRLST